MAKLLTNILHPVKIHCVSVGHERTGGGCGARGLGHTPGPWTHLICPRLQSNNLSFIVSVGRIGGGCCVRGLGHTSGPWTHLMSAYNPITCRLAFLLDMNVLAEGVASEVWDTRRDRRHTLCPLLIQQFVFQRFCWT